MEEGVQKQYRTDMGRRRKSLREEPKERNVKMEKTTFIVERWCGSYQLHGDYLCVQRRRG